MLPIGRIFPVIWLSLTLIHTPSAQADEVYWSTPDLLKSFFKNSERVTFIRVDTQPHAHELRTLLAYVPEKPSYNIFVAGTQNHIDGYAFIDDVTGEHLPITFGVQLSPEGKVERVEIMAYRERYGGEVRSLRFRSQFTGKGLTDSVHIGNPVQAVSGATISSKALSVGVRRAIVLVALARTATKAAP